MPVSAKQARALALQENLVDPDDLYDLDGRQVEAVLQAAWDIYREFEAMADQYQQPEYAEDAEEKRQQGRSKARNTARLITARVRRDRAKGKPWPPEKVWDEMDRAKWREPPEKAPPFPWELSKKLYKKLGEILSSP
jgi:hypothetical protein